MDRRVQITCLLRMVIVFLGAITLAGWHGLPVAAEGTSVQVEVVPTSVQVPPLGSVETLLILRNPTTDELANINLTYFPQDKVTIDFSTSHPDSVPAGGVRVWKLGVSRKVPTLIKENVYLRIEYERRPAGEDGSIPAIAVATLEVSASGPAQASKFFEVSTQMAEGAVMEHHAGKIYLFLKNATSEALSVDSIQVDADATLSVSTQVNLPLVLGSFDQVAVPYTVKLVENSQVQPGKTLVLFNVAAKTVDTQQQALASTTQAVNLGVLGESSILTLLGVPSLLVLPGFLMVVTFLWLWGWKPGPKPTTSATDPKFWLVAITLSMLMAAVYEPLTSLLVNIGILEQSRNYLAGYGLMDILVLWVVSILVAMLFYLVAAAMYILINVHREREKAKRTPKEGDKELVLLGKLQAQGLGVTREQVEGTMKSGESVTGFLLQARVEGQEQVWIGPQIAMTWLDEETPLKAQVKSLLASKTSKELARLVNLLEQGTKENVVQLKWKADAKLDGPRLVKLNKIKPPEFSIPIIRQELID